MSWRILRQVLQTVKLLSCAVTVIAMYVMNEVVVCRRCEQRVAYRSKPEWFLN